MQTGLRTTYYPQRNDSDYSGMGTSRDHDGPSGNSVQKVRRGRQIKKLGRQHPRENCPLVWRIQNKGGEQKMPSRVGFNGVRVVVGQSGILERG